MGKVHWPAPDCECNCNRKLTLSVEFAPICKMGGGAAIDRPLDRRAPLERLFAGAALAAPLAWPASRPTAAIFAPTPLTHPAPAAARPHQRTPVQPPPSKPALPGLPQDMHTPHRSTCLANPQPSNPVNPQPSTLQSPQRSTLQPSNPLNPPNQDDLVCLPAKLSTALGGLGPMVLVTRVTNAITLTDPTNLRSTSMDVSGSALRPFRCVASCRV